MPKWSIAGGIEAARKLFPRCWFDEGRCADAIRALRNYRYDVEPDTGQFSKQPLHDAFSHAADAFQYFAIGIPEPAPAATPQAGPNDIYGRRRERARHSTSGSGWAA